MTVQEVIDTILAAIPGEVPDTVDTLKTGDPSAEVTGIATTFLATHDVLAATVGLDANLIITHEPTFYNHRDEMGWLAGNPVYESKRRFIDEHRLAIWRFHDYWHRHRPDGILTGIVGALHGWDGYDSSGDGKVIDIPESSLEDLAAYLKVRLSIGSIRVVGDARMPCRRVAFLAGATGGEHQIATLSGDADVVIVGETNEWETCEYVRDAAHIGIRKALIVLGHCNSEEAGMAYLVDWLIERLPVVPIHHVPAGDPFRSV